MYWMTASFVLSKDMGIDEKTQAETIARPREKLCKFSLELTFDILILV